MSAPDQHPAAPEGDVSALTEKWLSASQAARKSEHHFPADCLAEAAQVVPALLADLTATRERLRAVEGERDAARAREDFVGTEHTRLEEAYAVQADLLDDATARAESSEAALAALRAGVEALADEWESGNRPPSSASEQVQAGVWAATKADIHALRALLAGGDR